MIKFLRLQILAFFTLVLSQVWVLRNLLGQVININPLPSYISTRPKVALLAIMHKPCKIHYAFIWSWFLFLSALGSFICICIFLFVFLYLHHLIVICTRVRTWGLFLCLYLFICIFIFVSFDHDLFSCQDLEEDSVLPCYCFSSQFLFAGFNLIVDNLNELYIVISSNESFIWLSFINYHLNLSDENLTYVYWRTS